MALRGTMKLYFSDETGKTFNISFTNADLETSAADIKLAANTIADSVIASTASEEGTLEFLQATGMVESVLATGD